MQIALLKSHLLYLNMSLHISGQNADYDGHQLGSHYHSDRSGRSACLVQNSPRPTGSGLRASIN